MKHYRAIAIVVLVALCINATLPVAPVKAQSAPLFEGTIAYIDKTGNVVLIDGMGGRRQITSDADAQKKDSSENRLPYGGLSFSPNGKYLAFLRYDQSIYREKTVVYDVQNNTILGEFDLAPAHFMKWHRDSDSFITMTGEYIDSIHSGDNYLNKIYRQYLSGEKVLLGEYYEGDAGYTINFNLNSVFYTPDSPRSAAILYNWVNNTSYQVDLVDNLVYGAGGFWSPDGRYYVWTGAVDGYYYVIELETGKIIKQINLHDIFPDLWQDDNKYDFPNDIAPDSKHLLINYDSHLYSLNLDTLSAELLYALPEESVKALGANPEFKFQGSWSRSGHLILVDYAPDYGERSLSVLENNHARVSIASNAVPLFWLSRDSERFVYVQYSGDSNGNTRRISNSLMIYDHEKQTRTKIGDLPDLFDLEIWYLEQDNTENDARGSLDSNYYVAWTDGKVDSATIPLITVTPDMNITPTVATTCPFEIVFQEKQGVINSLQNPPQISELETGFPIPLPFLEPSVWKYKEEEVQKLLDSLRRDCESYANGTMFPYQRDEFEYKVTAFKRLTQTEIALNGLFTQFLKTAFATSKPISDLLFGSLSIFFSISEFEGWLSAKDTGIGLADLTSKGLKEAQNCIIPPNWGWKETGIARKL
jgi:hypothetical protein